MRPRIAFFLLLSRTFIHTKKRHLLSCKQSKFPGFFSINNNNNNNMAPISSEPVDLNAPIKRKPVSYNNLLLGASKYIDT